MPDERKLTQNTTECPPPRYVEKMDTVVVLNVGGRRFETVATTLQNLPNTRLANLDKSSHFWRPENGEYFFDRHSEVFEAVLNYYRSGELHVPLGLCGPIVKRELDFWGIDDHDVEMCCRLAYSSYQSQKDSLSRFEKERQVEDTVTTSADNRWQRFRSTAWIFLNNPKSSKGAMTYAVISTIVIIISILSLILASHATFRTQLSDEDWAVYHKVSLKEFLRGKHGSKHGGGSQQPSSSSSSSSSSATNSTSQTTTAPGAGRRKRGIAAGGESTAAPKESNSTPTGNNTRATRKHGGGRLIGLMSALLDKNDEKYQTPEDMTTPYPCFAYINIVCIAFFTLEYLIRFAFSPRKLKFLVRPLNIIDVLSVLPFYIMEIIVQVDPTEEYKDSLLDIITALQVTRVFLVFRVMQHFNGFMVLMYTMKVSLKEIFLTFVFVCMGILIFGCLMYYVDSRDTYTDIPMSFWWAIVTMTTLGYGDMFPTTQLGYLVGSLCAMSGVLVIALTVPVVVSNFLLFYQYAVSDPNVGKTKKSTHVAKVGVKNDVYHDQIDIRKANQVNGEADKVPTDSDTCSIEDVKKTRTERQLSTQGWT